MLTRNVLADESVVLITANNSPRKTSRLVSQFGTNNQAEIVRSSLDNLARYQVTPIIEREYRDTIRMLFLGYVIRRKNE